MLAALAPARRRLVLGVLALVVAAVVAIVVVLVVGRSTADDDEATGTVPQDDLGPVLLVPGYGGTVDSLDTMAQALRDAGRDVTVVELPHGGVGALEDTAAVLAQDATAAMTRTGKASVDVVGYSAGGVAARYWIAHGGATEVRRIVTVSSPHHGSTLSDAAAEVGFGACGDGCRELSAGSDFLAQLNSGDETPAGPTWVSLWTTTDDTVLPPESAVLEGALDISVQSVCADATPGHGRMKSDPVVLAMVVAELAARDPVQLGPDDCARLGG